MVWFWDHYAPDPAARVNPYASPLRAPDLSRAAARVRGHGRARPAAGRGVRVRGAAAGGAGAGRAPALRVADPRVLHVRERARRRRQGGGGRGGGDPAAVEAASAAAAAVIVDVRAHPVYTTVHDDPDQAESDGSHDMRATAAVFEKLFTPLSVAEVEVDSPGPGEALVKIVASGVCHTDAIARDGDMPFPAAGRARARGRRDRRGRRCRRHQRGRRGQGGDRLAVVRDVPELPGGAASVLPGARAAGARGGRADGTTSLRRLDGSPLHSHFFGQSSFASYSICAASALVVVDPSTRTWRCSGRSPAGSRPGRGRC